MANKIFSTRVVVTVSLAQLALAACTVKVGGTQPMPCPKEEPAGA